MKKQIEKFINSIKTDDSFETVSVQNEQTSFIVEMKETRSNDEMIRCLSQKGKKSVNIIKNCKSTVDM